MCTVRVEGATPTSEFFDPLDFADAMKRFSEVTVQLQHLESIRAAKHCPRNPTWLATHCESCCQGAPGHGVAGLAETITKLSQHQLFLKNWLRQHSRVR